MSVKKTAGLLIGRCLPCLKPNTSKLSINKMKLDPNLMMYFDEQEVIYAHDPKNQCKAGDVALVEELPQKLTRLISYKVLEVVFACGDVVDPVTGKKVIGKTYRDEEEEINSIYGKLPDSFDYKSAPPRGWQENKKDFTHMETYTKYHDGDDSPNAV